MEPPRAPPPPELEFGGPWGAGALTLLLPLALVALVGASVGGEGRGEGGGAGEWSPPLALPTPPTLGLVLAWVLAHGAGKWLRPPRAPGDSDPQPPPGGFGGLVALGGAVGGALALGPPLPPLGPLLPQLAAAACAVAFGLGLLLAARQRLRGGGGGVHPVYDFFVGPELGTPLEPPQPLSWERQGLCAWGLVLLLVLGEQQRLRGGPSLPLALVAAAQGLCLLQRLQALRGAPPRGAGGFLGLFAALAWLPFGGPLPALLLLHRPRRPSLPRDSACGLLCGLPTVPTATGRLLLAGGWWGLVRRPEHLGELLMALGWSLPCGLWPPLALLGVLGGAALREHRAAVAERRCRRELGQAWERLCLRVPHRLLPHIY